MELKENNFLKEVPDLKNFEDFLQRRREQSQADLSLLSKNFNIPLESLKNIKNEIRDFLFFKKEGKFNLATTFHLYLWEFYQYKLAFEKEKLLKENFEEEFFNFFVYYDKEKKSIYYLKIGDIELSLKDILNLKINKEVSSFDFFQKIKEKVNLLDEKEEELIKQNLKNYFVNRGYFKNYTKKEQNLINERVYQSLKRLLIDYLNFFEKDTGNLTENIKKIDFLREKLFNNKDLKGIFQKFEIKEEDYQQTNKYRYFIALICILGWINHFGAEWATERKEDKEIQPGFYNQIRERLNLNKIIEPLPNVFIERYNFTSPFLDSLTLSIIFENDLDALIKTAAVNGLNSYPFTPLNFDLKGVDFKIVEKIRLLDFLKNYEIFLKTNLTRDKIKDIFIKNNFFDISELKEVFEKEGEDSNLESFINNKLQKEKFLVSRLLKQYLAEFYKTNPLKFLEFFNLDSKNLNLLELIDKNQKEIKSYGITLPLNLSLNYKDIFDFILLETKN